MILSAQSIAYRCNHFRSWGKLIPWDGAAVPMMITPFTLRDTVNGKSYGLSAAGYDIRVGLKDANGDRLDRITLYPGDFVLAYSLERIVMPHDLISFVKDKSSWAREGLAVQNTVLEPGWEGYITLELSYHRPKHKVTIEFGDPIAQLIFQKLDEPTMFPYGGKYQNQPDTPVEAIYEKKEQADD